MGSSPSRPYYDPYYQPPVIIYNDQPDPYQQQPYGGNIVVYENGLKKNLKELNLKELKNISKNMNINHDNNIKKKKLYELVYNHIKEQNK